VTSGLRALVRSAGNKPLDFGISAYVGQMLISGRPSPAATFYEAGRDYLARQIWDSREVRRARNEEARTARFREITKQPLQRIDEAIAAEHSSAPSEDELTLVDVYLFPAVGTQGTQSGGQWLPTARIPYSAVDVWWVTDGRAIPGRSGSQVGFGIGIGIPI
jgi:hypothetical protein